MVDQTVLGPITIGGPPANLDAQQQVLVPPILPTARSIVAQCIKNACDVHQELFNLLTTVKDGPSPTEEAAYPDSLMGDLDRLQGLIAQLETMSSELATFIGVEKS